jgi:hypothetical protein
MKKFYYVLPQKAAKQYDTYEDAEAAAKKAAGRVGGDMYGREGGDVFILETIACAKQPVPDVEVTKM